MAPVGNAHRRARGDDGIQGQDENGRSTADLRATFAGRGVRACLDEGALRIAAVPLPRAAEGDDGSDVGLLELQLNAMVRPAALVAPHSGFDLRLAA